tara:strand:- start:3131 stop:3790 length:660 start_codon:yes stop_codon:yes gene_type:complete
MKISNDTLSVLKNFAGVNTNILIREGNVLSTISTGKNILARATVAESFDREFAIYDLNSLLSLLTLMEDTDVAFGDESITVTKDRSLFEYYYADPEIIVSAPDKQIEVDDYFSFDLSATDLAMVMKAVGITAAPMLSVIGNGSEVSLAVGDPATAKSNSFTQVIGASDRKFAAHLQIENLKVISGDYRVIISEKKFMHLINTNTDVKYWLALDKSSEIS